MNGFLRALEEQRWDDHRYYHHNRINQSLHVVSALSFIAMYALLLTAQPVAAALVGWFVAMITRQIGHYFFEPKGYDEVNQATHAYKEQVKVGYNLRRKTILLSIWALSPLVLYLNPSLFGLLPPHHDWHGYLHNLALTWISLGTSALLFRTVQLFFVRDVQTGVVWFTKILTDPFHDIKLYRRAPLQVLRGELYDPAPAEHA
jgi:hypothetical protein